MRARCRSTIVALLMAGLLGAAGGHAQTDDPDSASDLAFFGGESGLTFAPNPQMQIASEGTVELTAMLGWEGTLPEPACVFSAADDDGVHFAAFLTPAGDGLILVADDVAETFAWDFADGAFHHVALAADHGKTEVLVDGESLGVAGLGWESLADKTLMLGHSDGEATFVGVIGGVRLWRTALGEQDFVTLLEFDGPVPETLTAARHLAAFSVFTDEADELVVLPPEAPELPDRVGSDSVPIRFDGASSLSFPAVGPLPARETGTIDFWVAAGWESALDRQPCLVAQADGPASRFAIRMAADRRGLLFSDGRQERHVPADFADGREHHVAVVTFSSATEVWIDGDLAGDVELGYGAQPSGEIHLGSCDGTTDRFVGTLADVRFWKTALSEDEILEYMEFGGVPGPGDPREDDLVALASFTRDGLDILIADDLAGPASGGRSLQPLRRDDSRQPARRKPKKKLDG